MNPEYLKLCTICLGNESVFECTDLCLFETFFRVIAIKNHEKMIKLCIWCNTTMKRTLNFINLALGSHKILYSQVVKDTIIKLHTPYNFGRSKIIHIDHSPTNIIEQNYSKDVDERLDTNIIVKNGEDKVYEKPEFVDTDNIEKETFNIEECNTLNESDDIRSKKCLNIDEMKFTKKLLSAEEQLEEINKKKNSKKYRKMLFHCEYCGVGFLTSDVFEEHMSRHSEVAGRHKCEICGIRFRSQEVFSHHRLAHRRRFTCQLCGAVFNRWSQCISHRYKCGAVLTTVFCPDCNKMFSDELSLKIHLRSVHWREKNYICDKCSKKFATKYRLTAHIRTHTGQKPFKCSQCERAFSSHSNLVAHRTSHSNERSYHCVECDTWYKSEKSLKRHFEQSAKHLPRDGLGFSCSQCTRSFTTEKLRDSHINVKHLSVKSFSCCHCGKTFINNSNKNKHVRRMHKE